MTEQRKNSKDLRKSFDKGRKDEELNLSKDNIAKDEGDGDDRKYDRYELDEPVMTTINRELKSICVRTAAIFLPCLVGKRKNELYDWDLWGPLIYLLLLCTFLGIGAPKDGHIVFTTVFFVNLFGAFLVTINAKFLGGKCGFFQNLSLIGYSILPITIAGIVMVVFKKEVNKHIQYKLVLSFGAFFWSTFSVICFLRPLSAPNKTLLISYPAILFFLYQTGFLLTM